MKKLLFLFALIAVLTMSAPSASYACSPAPGYPPSASENLSKSDVAFVGTVKSVAQDKSINGDYHVTFTVEETYKGSVDETVTVRTRSSSAACGYDDGYTAFKAGTVWAIYADGNTTDGYTTDSLSLNKSYSSVSVATKAMTALGFTPVDAEAPIMCTMQYAPVCGKAPDGTTKTYGNSCMLGAEKATFLYQGECTVEAKAPKKDLWHGSRGTDVTWLQQFLIGKNAGAAARALMSVGPTGYFGQLTRNALAEFQAAFTITPAHGYFGSKTRAVINGNLQTLVTFTGKLSAVDTSCFADGVCSVTVSGKKVILLTGMRMNIPPVGSIKGVESIGDLENEIGSEVEVYAVATGESGADYTLYGSTSYYIKVIGK